MKKIIAFLLVLVMALTLCACHKNEDPTLEPEYKDNKQSSGSNLDLSAFEGKLLKPYIELIASGNYYFRISTDTQVEVFTQVGKDKMVSIKTGANEWNLVQDANGALFLVAGDGYIELNESLSPHITAEQIESFRATFATSNQLANELVNLTYTDKTQSVNIPTSAATANLKHEEYVDKYGVLYSFFFDGANNNALVMYACIESKDKYSMVNIEFGEPSPNTISNIFLNYRKIDASELNAQQGQQTTTATTTQAPVTQAPTTQAPVTQAPAAQQQQSAPKAGN